MLVQSLFAATALVSPALAAGLQSVSGFGTNPTGLQMFTYVPSKVAAKPAIIVGVSDALRVSFRFYLAPLAHLWSLTLTPSIKLHPCGGNAAGWYSSKVGQYADTNGWVLIYAQTTKYSNCWDVNNVDSLTHGKGGDAAGIVSMVNYALNKYNGDPTKVFVYGGSSGAMMTNVMAGSYPDVFAAGAAFSGTAHACFFGSTSPPTPAGSNQTCAQGQINRSAASWGDLVRNSYPGYTGSRTRMAIFHGLADTLVRPACGYQALQQWGNVHGLTNTKNVTGVPSSAYTQIVYGDGSKVVGYMGSGVGHIAPVNEEVMFKFFGLI